MSVSGETTRDALERLVYRTERLLTALHRKHVFIPVWNAMCVERALELAREALAREEGRDG